MYFNWDDTSITECKLALLNSVEEL
jgi:hypothetical protein